jgi:glycosyltransferase involved in cell wall biosynthesis
VPHPSEPDRSTTDRNVCATGTGKEADRNVCPTVSVIMPVFNARRYVAAAVESVLGQTFGDFEFCIVDDGSTDGTDRILRKYADRDARIRLNRRPNTGLVGALNDTIKMARGELLARMDGDDVCLPDRLERQVAFLRAHPDHVAVGAQVETIDPYGCDLFRLEHKTDHADVDAELMAGRGFAMVHPSVMMRRAAVERVGGYDPKWDYAEDLCLFLKLAEVGKVANLPDVLLKYRQHYESVNHTKHDRQRALRRGIMEEAYARRGVPMPPGIEFRRSAPPPRYEQTQTWGWRALKSGNVVAARQHALDLVRLGPAKWASWKLMFCAWRGW